MIQIGYTWGGETHRTMFSGWDEEEETENRIITATRISTYQLNIAVDHEGTYPNSSVQN